MLLGKRQNPAIQKTASMTTSGVTFDLSAGDGQPPPPVDFLNLPYHYPTTNFSPRNINRRRSADFLETPPFLESCRLCTRRLVPGRDVYMYRGDSAFCSQECRQQQMIQDERKEKKCSMTTKKAAVAASAAVSKPATTGETVAAV